EQRTYRSSQVIPNVRIERVDIKAQANGAIPSWINKLSVVSTALQRADAYITESVSVHPYENSTHRSTSGRIKMLLPKYGLVHFPILDKDETQSTFSRMESGMEHEGLKLRRNLRGVPCIFALGGLNCVHL
ncbi:hypothetical protein P692DRAFT_20754606, partial [Suillus brevipes Sb2]